MDTKLKNRILIVVTILLLTFGINGVLPLLGSGGQYFHNYYKSGQFRSHLSQFEDYLSTYELNSTTEEEALAHLSVSDQEVKDYAEEHGNYVDDVQELPVETEKSIKKELLKTKQQDIKDYFAKRETNRPYLVREKTSFNYFLKNVETGEIYTDTNMNKDDSIHAYLQLPENKMAFVQSYPSAYHDYLSTQEHSDLPSTVELPNKNDNFSGFIAVPKNLPADSAVKTDLQHFRHSRTLFFIYTGSAILALIISLFMVYKRHVFQRIFNEKWQELYNRIPIDVSLVVFAIIGVYTLAIINDSIGYTFESFRLNLFNLVFYAIFIALTLVQAKLLWNRYKSIGGLKKEWEKSLTYRIFSGIGDGHFLSSTGIQMFIILFIVFCTGFGVPIVWNDMNYGGGLIDLYLVLFVVITLPALMILVKQLGKFNQISKHVDHLVKGYNAPDLPEKGWSPLKKLAKNINTLKRGVTFAQKEQSKSERLKTELITNVSHDLRTPLTSIITYSELLQQEDLDPADRDAYIEIIDRKSKRLKVLIEDLFEASKMASGNIELDKKKVDIVQLLQQALAENDDAIQSSTLYFRVAKPEAPLYAVVDGQKLWRVFDNLIGNILKYSLENTRVFITLQEVKGRVVITFKNITKYELNQNIDELFERFKRGDESRHTDGSGLGLAIAKSIIDLHEGDMDIEVDGDLFKVTVALDVVSD